MYILHLTLLHIISTCQWKNVELYCLLESEAAR